MPENARTFYQTLDGQVEQNKIYTKLAIPKILGTQNDIVCSKELLLKYPKLHNEISDLIRISAP
jgi:hypothetical protein